MGDHTDPTNVINIESSERRENPRRKLLWAHPRLAPIVAADLHWSPQEPCPDLPQLSDLTGAYETLPGRQLQLAQIRVEARRQAAYAKLEESWRLADPTTRETLFMGDIRPAHLATCRRMPVGVTHILDAGEVRRSTPEDWASWLPDHQGPIQIRELLSHTAVCGRSTCPACWYAWHRRMISEVDRLDQQRGGKQWFGVFSWEARPAFAELEAAGPKVFSRIIDYLRRYAVPGGQLLSWSWQMNPPQAMIEGCVPEATWLGIYAIPQDAGTQHRRDLFKSQLCHVEQGLPNGVLESFQGSAALQEFLYVQSYGSLVNSPTRFASTIELETLQYAEQFPALVRGQVRSFSLPDPRGGRLQVRNNVPGNGGTHLGQLQKYHCATRDDDQQVDVDSLFNDWKAAQAMDDLSEECEFEAEG